MRTEKPSTSAQLRDDIKSVGTKSNGSAPDPAGAPLGTDEEAADTTTSAHRVEMAREAETKVAGAAKRERDGRAVERAHVQRGSSAPYGKEEHMNNELAKQKESERVADDPSEQPS